MSHYGHDMEREFSAQSLSTRVGSEMGSRYTTEGGLYISSFAATIFISGLVTIGVSMLSLVVSLVVMLQSCEQKNSTIIEKYKDNYSYCTNFALHAELNGLDAGSFPAACKDVATQYIKEGQYMRDLNTTVRIIEDFFCSVRPAGDGQVSVLMDADDFFVSETLDANLVKIVAFERIKDANYWKHICVITLFQKFRVDGWPIILFSRKPEKMYNVTTEYLKSTGCRGWSSLIMRTENEMHMDSQEFLSMQRLIMQRNGFRIKAVISSQMDALRGPCLGDRIFKIPNPIFSLTVDFVQRINQ